MLATEVTDDYYRMLIDMSPDAVVVTDAQSRVIIANERAAALLGATNPREVVGRDGMALIASEDRNRAVENMRKLLVDHETVGAEYTVLRPDGERMTIEVRARVLVDRVGQPSAVLAIARDISDRKRAELALRASEAQQAAVAELGWWALKDIDIDDLMRLAVARVASTLHVEFVIVHEVNADGGR